MKAFGFAFTPACYFSIAVTCLVGVVTFVSALFFFPQWQPGAWLFCNSVGRQAKGKSKELFSSLVYAPVLPVPYYLSGLDSGWILPYDESGHETEESCDYQCDMMHLDDYLGVVQSDFPANGAVAALYLNEKGLRALRHARFEAAQTYFALAIEKEGNSQACERNVLKDLSSYGTFYDLNKLCNRMGSLPHFSKSSGYDYDTSYKKFTVSESVSNFSPPVRLGGYLHNYLIAGEHCSSQVPFRISQSSIRKINETDLVELSG